jgi:macrodomain Ter protein organizer (MatP/YcbG family)
MKLLFTMCLISAMGLIRINAQLVVSAPALETQTAVQSQVAQQSLTETINQSGTLSNIENVQQQVLSIYKQSANAVQNIQTFISVMENMDKIKQDIQAIGKYEHIAQKQGINLPDIFKSMEQKFMQCTDLVNSATEQDMTPAERINIVVQVAGMLENMVGSIAGIKTNIVSNVKNNILTNTIKTSLADVKLGPNVLNFNSK